MYRLPSGKKLNDGKIWAAMIDDNIFNHHFLDVKTGNVKRISEEFDPEPDKLLKKIRVKLNQRYFEIPKIPDKERHLWMKEFVEEMVDDEALRDKLNFVLTKSRSFQLFEKVLYPDKSGWIWGWVQGKVFKLSDKLAEWLDEKNIEVTEEWEYDDDCALCQLMKSEKEGGKAPTMQETKEAFLKAKEAGAIVGGELFEKVKKKNQNRPQ